MYDFDYLLGHLEDYRAAFERASKPQIPPFDNDFTDRNLSRFFYKTSLKNHLSALEAGRIGNFLAEFLADKKIPIRKNDSYIGQANYTPAPLSVGHIEVGTHMNASVLGHEIRHAWQHLELSSALLNPRSAQDFILFKRFIEADARAIQFGVSLQTIHAFRSDNNYAYNLIGCLNRSEKDICERNVERLEEICSSPKEIKMAMRRAFDNWIAVGPAQRVYEDQIRDIISTKDHGSLLQKSFAKLAGNPQFTEKEMNPDYPQQLAAALGSLGDKMEGNYLTETDGPDFNAPFYTRICNYQLEREVARIALTIK